MLKRCAKCGVEQPLEAFYANANRPDGKRSKCIPCYRAGLTPRPIATPEYKAAYRRRTGQVSTPYVIKVVELEIARAKRAEKAERQVAKDDAYRTWNDWLARAPAEWLSKFVEAKGYAVQPGTKAWYVTATEEEIEALRTNARAKYRERYRLRGDAERERQKIYKHANPDKVANWEEKRKMLAAAQSDGTLTRGVVGRMFADAKDCPYCCEPVSVGDKTLDHRNPLSRGGVHGVSNVVICCRTCNVRKRDLPFDMWMKLVRSSEAA
jgi:5-methylcytosine-specific restriction endonuclease McrA